MMHPDVELRHVSAEIGYGVFATRCIPAGTIVYVKDAMEIEVPPGSRLLDDPMLGPVIDKYSYTDHRGHRVLSWDIAKYVNHSNDCNTISTGYGFEIALRDIQPDEEVTDEYGIFNLAAPMPIYGEGAAGRTAVLPDDLDNFHAVWDERIKPAMALIHAVPQPLMSLLDRDTHAALMTYLNTGEGYRSVYINKYEPRKTRPRRRRRAGAA